MHDRKEEEEEELFLVLVGYVDGDYVQREDVEVGNELLLDLGLGVQGLADHLRAAFHDITYTISPNTTSTLPYYSCSSLSRIY